MVTPRPTATTAPVTRPPAPELPGATLVAGDDHTCSLRRSGAVVCWGDNHLGQLGDGTRTTRSFPVRVRGVDRARALFARGDTTCAVRDGGSVACWGALDFERSVDADRGLGIAQAPRAITALTAVRTLVSSPGRLCALDASGKVRCVTRGRVVDVPFDFTAARVASDERLLCAARADDGAVRCASFEDEGSVVPIPDFGLRARDALAVYGVRVCGLTEGALSCAAPVTIAAKHIRPPEPPPLPPGRVVAIAPTGHVTLAIGSVVKLDFDPAVSGFTLGRSPVWTGLARGADQIAYGDHHACAAVGDRVRCFGDNASGQLGQGTRDIVADAVDVAHLDDPIPAPLAPKTAALAKLKRDPIKPKSVVHAWANARVFDAPSPASLRGRLVDADDEARLDPERRRFGFVVEAVEGDFVRVASDPSLPRRCHPASPPIGDLHLWLHQADLAPMLGAPVSKRDEVLATSLDIAPGTPVEPNDVGGLDALILGVAARLPEATPSIFSSPRRPEPRGGSLYQASLDFGLGRQTGEGFAAITATGDANLVDYRSSCAKGVVRALSFEQLQPETPLWTPKAGWLDPGTPLVFETGQSFGKLLVPIETGPGRTSPERTCFDRLVGTLTLCTQPTPAEPDKPTRAPKKPKKKPKR